MNTTANVTYIDLPSPSPGTRRSLAVHRFGDPGARPRVYFQAALHADEWPGLLVVHHLLKMLGQAARDGRIQGEVVVVPVANPVGLAQYINGRVVGRFDFDGAGNFNRSFPDLTQAALDRVGDRLGGDPAANAALVRAALTAAAADLPRLREVDALKAELLTLSVGSDLVLDLHCDGESLLHLYANRLHRELAVELGAELGVAAVLLEDEAGGDPFDEANAAPWWTLRQRCGAQRPIPLGCFAATVELRGQADVYDHYAESDAARLLRFLVRRGVVAGDPGPLPDPVHVESPLDGVDVLTSPGAGILAYHKALGDAVARGEVVAELVDLTGADPHQARVPIRAATDGILFARMAEKLARPGQKICKIAGREKLAYRQPGKLLED